MFAGISVWPYLLFSNFQLVKAFLPNKAVSPRTLLSSELSACVDVVCVGDALYDCIANDDARGLTVDEMVQRHAWTAFPGGAPANVATALTKLSQRPSEVAAFAGCLGHDSDGDSLVALLDDIGVDLSLVQRIDGRPTRRVMVTRSMSGDREFGGFMDGLRAGDFSDCFLQQDTLLEAAMARIIPNAKWVVCSTLSLAFRDSAEAVTAFIKEATETTNCQLLVDVNWRTVFWDDEKLAHSKIMEFVQIADVVKLTDEEAEWLLEIPAKEALSNPGKVHSRFPSAFAVLVTAGEKGASYSIHGKTGMIQPFQVDVTETTGAGDAFTAGFLYGVLEHGLAENDTSNHVRSLVNFAAAAGALTCTNEGAIAAQPTLEQVESFLKVQKGNETVVD